MLGKQIAILVIASVILGLSVNLVSPNKIPVIGKYRSLSSGDKPIVPPNAEEGDPPFIAVDVAQMEHSLGKAMFLDAREPAEFECGTIPGSINLPFDDLPPGDLTFFFDSALGGVSLDHQIIIFCSGDECDLSLHLARNLDAANYINTSIFFGGSREWERMGFEMERGAECEE